MHIQAEDVQDSNYTIIMQLYCTNLEKKDLFGKVSKTSTIVHKNIIAQNLKLYTFFSTDKICFCPDHAWICECYFMCV